MQNPNKMKDIITVILILLSNISFGQPDPAQFYPKRIEEITILLKTDSLNYELIWERLDMKVALLMREQEQFNSVFILYPDALTCEKMDCIEYELDFEKIYAGAFVSKKIQLSLFKYYITRIHFYAHTLQLDKAYKDLVYLKNNVPLSEDWKLEIEYYFFKIYVLEKNYDKALITINGILEAEKDKVFFYDDNYNRYHAKVGLFKYFNKKEELLLYIKQVCRDSFQTYFENKRKNGIDGDRLKESSFDYLSELVYYMKEYNSKELPKYEDIYAKLCECNRNNVNYETINPNISDRKLKSIVSEI